MHTENFTSLKIKPTFNKEDIRRGYAKACREAHPDYGGNLHEFETITKAYETLLNQRWTFKTEVYVPLKYFLTGCQISAMVEPTSSTDSFLIEFALPAYTYPGVVLKFTDGDYTFHITMREQHAQS